MGRASISAALLVILAGCSGGKQDDSARRDDITQAIEAGGDLPEVSPETVVTGEETSTELVGNETWICNTKSYDVTKAPDKFPLFDPNSEVVWPGNLLQGKSLGAATPEPIPVRRGSGTVVLTLMTGAEQGVSRHVDELSMHQVYDASNAILAVAPDVIPARFTFTMERVDSETQLRAAADVSFSGWGADVAASLSFSRDQSYNRFLVRLQQSFYTIAVEPPLSPADAFAPDVTAEDLAEHVGSGNPATFVSSVTYGRVFYLLFESTERVNRMETALNASFSGWGVDVGANASANYVGNLSELRVKAFALGGDAGDAIYAITNSFDDLKEFLARGGTLQTGVPISYVVRSVRHPEKVVKVALNDSYDVTDCSPVAETFGEPILWYAADDIKVVPAGGEDPVDPTGPIDVTLWKDRSAAINDAYDERAAGTRPTYVPWAVNGKKPAVAFATDEKLRFFGGGFVPPPGAPAEYTIMMVAAFQANQPLGVGGFHLIDGSTGGPGHVLRVGYQNTAAGGLEFGFDNGSLGVYAPHSAIGSGEQLDFHLYTLVYGETVGMALYVDGALYAFQPDAKEPLTDFFGAHLGMNDPMPGSVWIAEIMAHRTALTAEQRRYVEYDLMRKYGF